MEHFKKNWGFYLILLSIAVFFSYKKNWFGLFAGSGVKVNSTGSEPNTADCGGQRTSQGEFGITLNCTAPLYATGKISLANGVKEVKERCFTLDQFGGVLTESDMSAGTSIRLPYPYNNTSWSYNRQMGEKFCFVDNTNYPCDKFNCNP